MQRLWYYFLRLYVKVGLFLYFKKIAIDGQENVPRGPVIFAANHQNAFMDALLIVCFNRHFTHFLTRADIFKRPFNKWLLSTLNMIPVFRIRDGWESLSENQKTFELCHQAFSKNEAIVIFPEGNHGLQRRIRPLSKGFVKIAFESIQKDHALGISVVPVGLNYSDHSAFQADVRVIFGKPFFANDYFKEPLQQEANRFRNELSECLKKLTVHVENENLYTDIVQKLNASHPDYLNPTDANIRILKILNGENLESTPVSHKKSSVILYPLHWLSSIINFLPLAFWRAIQKKIKDPVFVSSMRFGVGIFLLPAFYLLIAGVLFLAWGSFVAGCWLLVAVLTIPFLKN